MYGRLQGALTYFFSAGFPKRPCEVVGLGLNVNSILYIKKQCSKKLWEWATQTNLAGEGKCRERVQTLLSKSPTLDPHFCQRSKWRTWVDSSCSLIIVAVRVHPEKQNGIRFITRNWLTWSCGLTKHIWSLVGAGWGQERKVMRCWNPRNIEPKLQVSELRESPCLPTQ